MCYISKQGKRKEGGATLPTSSRMRRPYCQCSTCTVTNKCIHTPAFVEVVCPLSPWCSTSGCFRLGLLQFSRLENANQENITTSSWQEEYSRLLIVVSRLSSASLHHRTQKVHLIKTSLKGLPIFQLAETMQLVEIIWNSHVRNV